MWTLRHRCAWLVFLAGLAISSASANAQDRPKGELFLGFSGRTNGDPVLKGWNASAAFHINEPLAIVADFSGHYGSLPGPGAITLANLPSFLQGNPSQWLIPRSDNPLHVYSFLAGPQFSNRINDRTRIFVRALFGASRVDGSQPGPNYYFIPCSIPPGGGTSSPGCITVAGQSGLVPGCNSRSGIISINSGIQSPVLSLYPATAQADCPTDTRIGFSFGAGGGLDVTIAKHWAVRVFQADYINKPDVLEQGANDFRLSSGLLYQW